MGLILSNAAALEQSELQRLAPEDIYQKATGVMTIIARTPEERLRYEARRLAELDFKSYIDHARRFGLKEGREEGMSREREEGLKLGLAEQSRAYHSILQEPLSDSANLVAMEFEALAKLCEEWKQRLLQSR